MSEAEQHDEKNEFFYRLTPEVVLHAVEESGLHPSGHCQALNSLENRVFNIGLDDGSHIVAKFYRPLRWSREQIEEEHEFLYELIESEIPALAPRRFPDGSSLQSVRQIHYAIWPLTGGREPAEFTEEEFGILGRLLGRIHNTGATKKFQHRPGLTPERLALEPLEFLLQNNFIPDELKEEFRSAVYETAEIYEKWSEGIPVHRIHGDCHISNLLFGRDGWFFLDFDDCCSGPAVQDIWMICSGRDEKDRANRDIFLNAYRTFRDFDDAWLKLIEPLRTLRYIHYTGWIARRWEDPSFPAAFPHFGTPEYWHKELQDLKEQLSHYRNAHPGYFDFSGGPGGLSEEEPEEELTNKDFFWDIED